MFFNRYPLSLQYYRFPDVTLTAFETIPNKSVSMTVQYYTNADVKPNIPEYDVDPTILSGQ